MLSSASNKQKKIEIFNLTTKTQIITLMEEFEVTLKTLSQDLNQILLPRINIQQLERTMKMANSKQKMTFLQMKKAE